MATYNWAYRPGIKNKYGILIDNSADDVKPANACYVALFGNDETGNGSRMYPFRTLAYAKQFAYFSFLIVGAGVYRENIGDMESKAISLIADGDVKIDLSYFLSDYFVSNLQSISLYNFSFEGSGLEMRHSHQETNFNAFDCLFDNIFPGGTSGESQGHFRNCIFKNLSNQIVIGYYYANTIFENCTFTKCSNVSLWTLGGETTNVIFHNCNITFLREQIGRDRYCMFYHCNFRIMEGGNHYDYPNGALYPAISDDFTYIDNIDDLRQFIADAYPLSTVILKNCSIADPKFNNPGIGDYSLMFDSPAKNASYFGTSIGAVSLGYPIKARSEESDGSFDFSTNQNLTITDDSIILTDPDSDASIETVVISNLIQRELEKAPLLGFNADRNGQYIDSFADLSDVIVTQSENLKAHTPYLVEEASIAYDGNPILAGDRFTTNSVLSFSTNFGGVCREILEAPQRHTILARFSNGGATKAAGENLTVNYWYYVDGTVTYNGHEYTNQTFKAVNGSSFTGEGTVIEAMTTEVFNHYEPGIKFTANTVDDTRLGEILRGNGDPDYERGEAKEFPINSKFIQVKYIIRVKNLKP